MIPERKNAHKNDTVPFLSGGEPMSNSDWKEDLKAGFSQTATVVANVATLPANIAGTISGSLLGGLFGCLYGAAKGNVEAGVRKGASFGIQNMTLLLNVVAFPLTLASLAFASFARHVQNASFSPQESYKCGNWASQQLSEHVGIEIPSVSSYTQNVNVEAFVTKYNELKDTNPAAAKAFLESKDDDGKTFFHALAAMNGLQKTSIMPLREMLGDNLADQCFLRLKDSEGKTPFDLALEKGQLALVSLYFPLPDNTNLSELNAKDVAHLKTSIENLLTVLSDPDDRTTLLNSCIGENDFDKLEHIITGLHLILCSNLCTKHDPLFVSDVQKLIASRRDSLPRQIVNYANLDLASQRQIHSELCSQASSLTDIETIKAEFDKLKPKQRQANSINMRNLLPQDETKLQAVIRGTLSKNPNKDAYFNYLSEVTDPYAPYNQKIDFEDPKAVQVNGNPIIKHIIQEAIADEEYDLNEVEDVIRMLVYKSPDLFCSSKERESWFKPSPSNTRETHLKHFVASLDRELDHVLFENKTKKNLIYYLEARGRIMIT